ncbi:hypothetical protein ACH4Q6_32075 [Streptomyces lydicus]|uniref:hypothetical protein n=1 Tax=Streptomyces lydicus TaxID=47763 RepID=UPI003795FB2D
MTNMTSGSVSRAVRAAIFAVVCVTTAALGHALMSARPLPWWVLVAALGATGSAAWWSAGRARGGFVVTGSSVLAQLALHSLFGQVQSCRAGLCPGSAQASSAMPMGGMAGMSRLTDLAGVPATSAVHAGALGAPRGDLSQAQMLHAGHGTLGMFLAHALAASVCGVWMWRGEAAVCGLARNVAAEWCAPFLLALTALGWTGLEPTARPLLGAAHVPCLRGVFLHHVPFRRGPPLPSFCC